MRFSKFVAAISLVVGGGVAYAEDDKPTEADLDVDVKDGDDLVDVDIGDDEVDTIASEHRVKLDATPQAAVQNKRACKTAEVFFRFDSAQLSPADDAVLQPLVDQLNKYEGTTIVLDGFADPRGSDAYNVVLSGKRADAVRSRMISMGAPKERIVLGLHGEKGDRRDTYADDRRVTAWATRNTTAQIIDHQLSEGATAMVWGDQMESLSALQAQQDETIATR